MCAQLELLGSVNHLEEMASYRVNAIVQLVDTVHYLLLPRCLKSLQHCVMDEVGQVNNEDLGEPAVQMFLSD